MTIAERIRAAVHGLDQRHDGQGLGARVTVSLGVAAVAAVAGDDPRRLIEMADANLYAAKRAGRNRVCAQPADETRAPGPVTGRVLDFKQRSAP